MTSHIHKWTLEHAILPDEPIKGLPVGYIFALCDCGMEIDEKQIVEALNMLSAIAGFSDDD